MHHGEGGEVIFDADALSKDSSPQIPTPLSSETDSELDVTETFQRHGNPALHQYLWQHPSAASARDTPVYRSQCLPYSGTPHCRPISTDVDVHSAANSERQAKGRKRVPYEPSWHDDFQMRKTAARERQINKDETSGLKTISSELRLRIPEELKCLHNRARFPTKNGKCSYPGCEGANPGACDPATRKEACCTFDESEASPTEANKRSNAREISSVQAQHAPTNIAEEASDHNTPQSTMPEQFDRVAWAHRVGDKLLETIQLARSKADERKAHLAERHASRADGRVDESTNSTSSTTVEVADAQTPAGMNTDQTAGTPIHDAMVSELLFPPSRQSLTRSDWKRARTRSIGFWAFQIVALLVQGFVVPLLASGESLCLEKHSVFMFITTVLLLTFQATAFVIYGMDRWDYNDGHVLIPMGLTVFLLRFGNLRGANKMCTWTSPYQSTSA